MVVHSIDAHNLAAAQAPHPRAALARAHPVHGVVNLRIREPVQHHDELLSRPGRDEDHAASVICRAGQGPPLL